MQLESAVRWLWVVRQLRLQVRGTDAAGERRNKRELSSKKLVQLSHGGSIARRFYLAGNKRDSSSGGWPEAALNR